MAQTFKSKTLISRTGVFSHEINAPNIVYNTGSQTITGVKTFIDTVQFTGSNTGSFFEIFNGDIDIEGANVTISGGNINLYSRPTVNGTGVLLIGEVSAVENVVYTTGNQIISGIKTFDNRPFVNGTGVLLSGEAASLPSTIVYTTGNQTINGVKTFADTGIFGNMEISVNEMSISGLNLILTDGTGIFYDKVGIGTNTPTEKLEVNGNVLANNLVYNTGNQTINGLKTFEFAPIISGHPVITGVDLSSLGTSANLDVTGSTLYSYITSLSGELDTAQTDITTTGSNLYSYINSLSGELDTTQTNIATTGSNLSSYINSLSGELDTTQTNIATTGSNLSSYINSLSGELDTTQTNIATTGSNLHSYVNSLSGELDSTQLNISSTGSSLYEYISSFSGEVDLTQTNIYTTGFNLYSYINSLSGELDITQTNIYSTGSSLYTYINSISGELDGAQADIISSGANLYQYTSSLSGEVVLKYGNQNISGNKVFLNNINVSGTGFFENINISNLGELVISGAKVRIEGNSGVYINTSLYVSGNPVLTGLSNLYSTSEDLNLTGSNLYAYVNSLSGELDATQSNLYTTGSNLYAYISSLSGELDTTQTNIATTGSNLHSYVNSLSGELDTTQTNIATTGSNLSSYINSLSGEAVLLYGNQTVNGLKDFSSRPTVNTVPVLLSGENSNGLVVLVKNDEPTTLLKGQPVYIYGANGNNILVRKASNTGEAYSSKTLGLLAQNLASNAQGFVITEGALEEVDTSLAGSAGDPIWLGSTGDLIFGLANKPYAPNNLVYLGVVERKHAIVGKIYVKVQNGFELEELHNVNINHTYPLNNHDVIRYDAASGLWFNQALNTGMFKEYIDSLSGEAVLKYGDQIISGIKTFNNEIYGDPTNGLRLISSTGNSFFEQGVLIRSQSGVIGAGNVTLEAGRGFGFIGDGRVNVFNSDFSINHLGISRAASLGKEGKFLYYKTGDSSPVITIESNGISVTNGGGIYISGKPVLTGVDLSSFGTSVNIGATGSTLYSYITSLSGELDTAQTNIATTGSNLHSYVNSLSGELDATQTNIATTGSNLSSYINSLSGDAVLRFGAQNISGNKTFIDSVIVSGTGIFNAIDLNNIDNLALSGIDISITGSTVNVYGNILISGNPVLTGIPDGSWATQAELNSLSGYINSTGSNIVFTTGDQSITGQKIFQDKILVDLSTPDVSVPDNKLQTTSFLVAGQDLTAGGQIPSTVIRGAVFLGKSDGSIGTLTNSHNTWGPEAFEFAGVNFDVTQYKNVSFTAGYFPQLWLGTNGNVGIHTAYPSERLEVNGNVLANNLLYNTGANNISGTLTANNLVYNTGNQTVSGIKTFASDMVVSGTGIFNGLNLENISSILLSGMTINITGGSTVNAFNPIRISGFQVLTGVNQDSRAVNTYQEDQVISSHKYFSSGISSSKLIGVNFTDLIISGFTYPSYAQDYKVTIAPGSHKETVDITNANLKSNFYQSYAVPNLASTINSSYLLIGGHTNYIIDSGSNATGIIEINSPNPGGLTHYYTWPDYINRLPQSPSGVIINIKNIGQGIFTLSGAKVTARSFSNGMPTAWSAARINGGYLYNLYPNENITLISTGSIENTDELRLISLDSSNNYRISGNPVLTGVDLSLYATISNLALTGSVLQDRISNLSGVFNTTGASLQDRLTSFSGIALIRDRNQTHSGDLTVTGHFSAASKSFLIDHPTKIGKKLQYGSLEGPENGVYVRGKTDQDIINLPNYWEALVDNDSISVNLTPIYSHQNLYVLEYNNRTVKIDGNNSQDYFYVVYGERKDIPKLTVEF